MTLNQLRECSCRQLADIAKREQISGWHGMRKDELVEALHRLNRNRKRREARRNGHSNAGRGRKSKATVSGRSNSPKSGHTSRKVQQSVARSNGKRRHPNRKSVPTPARLPLRIGSVDATDERPTGLFAAACDPRWIHVTWCVTRRMVDRALASLGLQKHTAVPVIRVFDATRNDQVTGRESLVDEVEIGADVDNWYVRIDDPSKTYKVHIGLRSLDGRFVAIARSRGVKLPRTEEPGSLGTWKSNGQSPARSATPGSKRPGSNGKHYRQLREHNGNGKSIDHEFQFELDAELIVHGNTHPDAELTLFGEPVPLREDGSFSLRVRVPEGRQVIPAQAVTPNRSQRRTIVLSLERNTKELEPQSMEDSPI